MRSQLRRIRRIVFETPVTEAESVGSRGSSSDERKGGSGEPLPEYDPDALSSRKDFLTETGMLPEKFFLRLVEQHDGSLPQKRFTEFTDLSKSTISRILREMEEDGQVVMVTVGRGNTVFLPEEAPTDGFPTADEPDSVPRA